MTRRGKWLVGLATLSVVLLFVAFAALTGKTGFPLDDAWIHQTYARNLVGSGRWEYTPGSVSAGSTSPLWTLMLTIGYLLKLPYLFWAHLLGGLSLLAIAFGGMRLWCLLWPDWAGISWLPGLAIVSTWPLVWAAVSGMETLLFAAIGMWVITLFIGYRSNASVHPMEQQVNQGQDRTLSSGQLALLGVLSGLLILTRPDGLVLVLLLLVGISIERQPVRKRGGALVIYVSAAILPLIPYLAFNLANSGNIWPNTFYAKQAEYAELLAQPILSRLFRLMIFSLGGPESGWRGSSGAHLFLLPGLLVSAWQAIRTDSARRRLRCLLPLVWAGGHVLLYAWRLPVTYHHGRYLFAAIPIWVLYGVAGWRWLLGSLGSGRVLRLGGWVAKLSFVTLVLVFLLLGAQAYATDVAFIEGEMVNVAHWLAENTPADALIAAHDIGAIGYFAERPLLDLAGLITPEIIPLLTDETALDRYIRDSRASYLVTAPGWPYEALASSDAATFEYTTGFEWTREQGFNNMTVYQLHSW